MLMRGATKTKILISNFKSKQCITHVSSAAHISARIDAIVAVAILAFTEGKML